MVEVGPYGVCWLKALGASGEGTGAVS